MIKPVDLRGVMADFYGMYQLPTCGLERDQLVQLEHGMSLGM